jgi:23S rRNA (pseudouridine1915-N3)-methyltransferase
MPGLSFVFVGKMRERHYAEAFEEYFKRLGAFGKPELREIAEERLPEQPSEKEIARALEREAAEIEKAVPKGAHVVALCVEGREMSSPELARTLDAAMGAGASKLCFVVGGSFGLHERVKKAADLRLSMSRMTFPHHLARVMLAEQVYRAFTIINGGRYHK